MGLDSSRFFQFVSNKIEAKVLYDQKPFLGEKVRWNKAEDIDDELVNKLI